MGKISLFDFDILNNEVFYRSLPIFKWIERNPNMSLLDREAIKATIMDALVTRGCIDPSNQSLNLEEFSIEDNLEHYVYDKCPNVCGIPLWLKDEFRKKLLKYESVSVAIYLALPSCGDEGGQHCIIGHNRAASSVFDDATFYHVFYTSPTRGVKTDIARPFVEVNIYGVPYLIDVLTKRIFKSSFFRESYGWEVSSSISKSQFVGEYRSIYDDEMGPCSIEALAMKLFCLSNIISSKNDINAELLYEIEQAKKVFPEVLDEIAKISADFSEKTGRTV